MTTELEQAARDARELLDLVSCNVTPDNVRYLASDVVARLDHALPVVLDPCPFCGHEATIQHRDGMTAICGNHDCRAHSKTCSSANQAAKAWNRRDDKGGDS